MRKMESILNGVLIIEVLEWSDRSGGRRSLLLSRLTGNRQEPQLFGYAVALNIV